jgi:hypothetical protein
VKLILVKNWSVRTPVNCQVSSIVRRDNFRAHALFVFVIFSRYAKPAVQHPEPFRDHQNLVLMWNPDVLYQAQQPAVPDTPGRGCDKGRRLA